MEVLLLLRLLLLLQVVVVVRLPQGAVAEVDHYYRQSPPSRPPLPLRERGVWTGPELVEEAALAAEHHSCPKKRESVAGAAQHG